MGIASTLRNLIGAAPQTDLDALRASVQGAADVRAATDEMKALVASVRAGPTSFTTWPTDPVPKTARSSQLAGAPACSSRPR